MGNVNPPKHGTALAAQQFIDKLAELTGGKTQGRPSPLGRPRRRARGGAAGPARHRRLLADDDGAAVDARARRCRVFQLPYIFRDYAHVYAALDGSDTLRKYYDAGPRQEGPEAGGLLRGGLPRASTATSPINSVADVKGKKIRVQEDKILVATFKALGNDLDAHRVPGGGDVAADEGDRLRPRAGSTPSTTTSSTTSSSTWPTCATRTSAWPSSCPRPRGRSRTRPTQKAIMDAAKHAEQWNREVHPRGGQATSRSR